MIKRKGESGVDTYSTLLCSVLLVFIYFFLFFFFFLLGRFFGIIRILSHFISPYFPSFLFICEVQMMYIDTLSKGVLHNLIFKKKYKKKIPQEFVIFIIFLLLLSCQENPGGVREVCFRYSGLNYPHKILSIKKKYKKKPKGIKKHRLSPPQKKIPNSGPNPPHPGVLSVPIPLSAALLRFHQNFFFLRSFFFFFRKVLIISHSFSYTGPFF